MKNGRKVKIVKLGEFWHKKPVSASDNKWVPAECKMKKRQPMGIDAEFLRPPDQDQDLLVECEGHVSRNQPKTYSDKEITNPIGRCSIPVVVSRVRG